MGMVAEGYSYVWRKGEGPRNVCRVWSHYGHGEGRIHHCLQSTGVVREGYSCVWRLGDVSGNFYRVWSHYGGGEGKLLHCLETLGGIKDFPQGLETL